MEEFDLTEFDFIPASPPQGPIKQAAKAAAGSAIGLPGSLLELGRLQTSQALPGEQAQYQRESELLEKIQQGYKPSFLELLTLSDDDILPRYHSLPTPERIEKALGQAEGEEASPLAQRVGRGIGAGLVGGGLPGALRFGGAGAIGHAVEKATGSPLAGLGAELFTGISPDLLRGFAKKVVPPASLKAVADQAKKVGLTDEQTTALLKSKDFQKAVGKWVRRGKKAEELGEGSLKTLGKAYKTLKNSAGAQKSLPTAATRDLVSSIRETMGSVGRNVNLPTKTKRALEYLNDSLFNMEVNGATGEELMNWFQSLNQEINWKTIKESDRILASVKKPIIGALDQISPRLGEEFSFINNLYARGKNLAKALEPGALDTLADLGEMAELVKGIATLSLKDIKAYAGAKLFRRGAQSILSSPRLYGIQRKIIKALNEGKGQQALNLARRVEEELRPEAEEGFSLEDFDFVPIES